ncbi:MAG: hypothetical protein IKJ59_00340 [Clostridia bacterium]|nr:hypothetical protein [Clostridia bacterium]
MSTPRATLKLYKATDANPWRLVPGKLFKIDNISDYLATFTPLVINNFQYVRQGLEIEIKVDLPQDVSQPGASLAYQYVSILNIEDGARTCYYFVKRAVQRSQNTVRFELVMDVLNTFQENSEYVFKANTKITREHKNRFTLEGNTHRLLVITFDDYNLQVSNIHEHLGNQCTIYFTASIYFDKLILSGIDEANNVIKGLVFMIPDDYTATDNEILGRFRNWSGEYYYEIHDSQGYLMDIMFYEDEAFSGDNTPYFIRTGSVFRNIDKTPENISPLLISNLDSIKTIQTAKWTILGNWYLLYRNQDNPSDSLVNPVECYLIPEKTGLKVDSGYVASGRLIPSYLEEGKWYWFKLASGQNATLSNSVVASPILFTRLLITKAGNKINIICFHLVLENAVYKIVVDFQYDDIDYIDFTGLPIDYNRYDNFPTITSSFITDTDVDQYQFKNTTTYVNLDPITNLDRTDAKNIKLLKLPYCPYNFTLDDWEDNQVIPVSGTDWELTSLVQSGGGIINVLKLKDLNTRLSVDLEAVYNPLQPLFFKFAYSLNPALTDLRKDYTYESKLYHSEFYQPTFYYDSFAFKIELEKCDIAKIYSDYDNPYTSFNIKFDVTRTINSKFMFTFDTYKLSYDEQNYSKYLPIARNNEEVLYNVPYINYIRSGYQYDVKNKNISNISNAIGIGLSGASLVASLAIPSAPLKFAGVVGSIVSLATSAKNAVASAISNEVGLKQKIAQYQNQSASVAGSDDVDLMSIYSDNRLKYRIYNAREQTRNLLFDLFFYAGYKSERMGIPTHNNRMNFDYLECDASIEAISSIPSDCLEELINCFKNGVTYIHRTSRVTDSWDVEQKYENWEKIFFN